MDLLIRGARVDDADPITVLNRDQMGYEYPVDRVAAALANVVRSEREVVFVAELDQSVVGYVHAEEYRLLYAPVMVNVLGIAVARGANGQGVGAQLMQAVEEWGRARGASALRLVSGETRDGAHAFYRRLGYVSHKRQLNFRKDLD